MSLTELLYPTTSFMTGDTSISMRRSRTMTHRWMKGKSRGHRCAVPDLSFANVTSRKMRVA